jgi:hypothetical protein
MIKKEDGTLKKPFNDLLSETIDDVLNSMGATVKNTIYLYLSSHLNISKSEIPLRLNEFFGALEVLFGKGAKQLNIQMVEKLEQKTGITQILITREGNLADYIRFIKQEYDIVIQL